jgi:GMP synthase (glutamine-hydrolysing)
VGIILSGGPSSVYDKGAPHADPRVFDLGLPVLGICYGLQFMVFVLGGKVIPATKREYGHAKVELQVNDSQLFAACPSSSPSGCPTAIPPKNCPPDFG